MNRGPEIVVAADVGAAAGARLAAAIAEVVGRRGACRLALPGGTGPVSTFQWLAARPEAVRTDALRVTWVDERHRPAGPGTDADWRTWSADTNRRLAWEHWWSVAGVHPAELPLDAPGTLAEARAVVAGGFATFGGLDVVLLGVGPDGHVASLFPGHPALDLSEEVIAVTDSPKPPPERLTLSLKVLGDVDHVVLVATGEGKAEVVARAARGDRDLPLGRLNVRGRATWVLDSAAARHLRAEV